MTVADQALEISRRRLRWGLQAACLVLAMGLTWHWFGPLFAPGEAPAMPADAPPEVRFGLPRARRLEIFRGIAAHEPAAAKEAATRFPKHAWSQQDDRANRQSQHIHRLAKRHKIHVSVAYAILEEGIRERWTAGPGAAPLTGGIVPLELRKQ